ncbi:unnamed protein product [Fusarium venenatum]|uniref:Uncharacterized protein n=1 Tax=Fusarium venenatum TaxID=56646 RepID=A0A2L2T9W8_9HYPO|nr:uncharacterized protein FVRRES_04236 [Fusarium venenatum]CEI67724.1 unnamed protein product [Fusarium venenatum]
MSVPKSPSCHLEDSLALATVVYALDYVYIMALDETYSRRGKPTDSDKESNQSESDTTEDSGTEFEASDINSGLSRQQPDDGFQDLLTHISEAFPIVIKKLWLFYELQERARFFLKLKKRSQEKTSAEILGKQLETRDIFGWTALHYAAACRDLKVVGRNSVGNAALSDRKRPGNLWLDNLGRGPVHIASLTGNSEFLKMFLITMLEDDVRSTLKSTGLDGMTPVHLAIAGGHEKCLDVFSKLSFFFDLDSKEDAWKRSPVHLAIFQGQYSCCTALLESGKFKFNPSALDTLGNSILPYLDEKDDEQKETGHLLLRNYSETFQEKDKEGKDKFALHYVVESEDCDNEVRHGIIIGLVQAMEGADMKSIDVKENHGRTPPHIAAEKANSSVVFDLLNSGADPNTKDKDGENALHRAVMMWSNGEESAKTMLEITLRLLRKAPGCMGAWDNTHGTPLTWACRSRSIIYRITSGGIKD